MTDSFTEIEAKIKKIKEEIFCHENGDDSYYISPLYHQHLIELQALENEKLMLTGKIEPAAKSFTGYELAKSKLLQQLAKRYGYWFADSCRELNVDDLNKFANS